MTNKYLIYIVIDNQLHKSNWYQDVVSTNNILIDPTYIEKGEFVLCSTCTGLGDWAVLSAIPRLLKKKYPNCKVYIPTKEWFRDVMGPHINFSTHTYAWDCPESHCETIFKNNPYIDGFKDNIEGVVYTDHFRYVGDDEYYTPLAQQILRFYKLSDDEIDHVMPEIYFSDEEIALWDSKFSHKEPYGCLTLSITWDKTLSDIRINAIKEILDFYELPIIYYGANQQNIANTHFKDYSKNTTNMLDITNDIRFQTYIRSKARFNVGNQSGVLEILPRYSETYIIPRLNEDFKSYFIRGIKYYLD